MDEAVRKRIEEAIPWVITHYPRKSGCGPAESRFEHWGSLSHNPAGLAVCATVLTRLLLGEAPVEAVAAHLCTVLAALPKTGGGVRPIACGSVLRRIAGKAACRALSDEMTAAAARVSTRSGGPAAVRCSTRRSKWQLNSGPEARS